MRYGIGFKLGLLLASFGLVAMGLVGYYAYASSRATLLKAAQGDLLRATQVLGRSFQASIDEIAADTALLASLPISAGIASARQGPGPVRDQKLLTDMFAAMLAVHPEYFQIRLIGADRHGLELVRVDRDGDQLIPIAAPDLQEKAHYPYVFNTLQLGRGQVYLSSITINHEEGAHSGLHKPSVRVATPVLAEDGKVRGSDRHQPRSESPVRAPEIGSAERLPTVLEQPLGGLPDSPQSGRSLWFRTGAQNSDPGIF